MIYVANAYREGFFLPREGLFLPGKRVCWRNGSQVVQQDRQVLACELHHLTPCSATAPYACSRLFTRGRFVQVTYRAPRCKIVKKRPKTWFACSERIRRE